jgi:hypothetical protein
VLGQPPREDDELDDVEHVVGLAGPGILMSFLSNKRKVCSRVQSFLKSGSILEHYLGMGNI